MEEESFADSLTRSAGRNRNAFIERQLRQFQYQQQVNSAAEVTDREGNSLIFQDARGSLHYAGSDTNGAIGIGDFQIWNRPSQRVDGLSVPKVPPPPEDGQIVSPYILNPSFESQADFPYSGSDDFQALYLSSTAIEGWKVVAGSVDWLNSKTWQTADGKYALDMSGSDPTALPGTLEGKIRRAFRGRQYQLTFALSGNPQGPPAVKTLQVKIGSQAWSFTFDTSSASQAGMGWVDKKIKFRADSNNPVLQFQSLVDSSSAFGPCIDKIRITAIGG